MKLSKYIGLLLASVAFTSCGEDYLTDMPSSNVTSDQIANEAAKDPAKALGSQLSGAYSKWNFHVTRASSDLVTQMSVGWAGLNMLSNVMGNDMSLSMGSQDPWNFDHGLDYNSEQYYRSGQPWNYFYTIIKSCNEIIPSVDSLKADTEGKAILGQVLAMRGISYAYLAQWYQLTYKGHENLPCVPLLLSSEEQSINTRATVQQVYDRAETDLLGAIRMLKGYKRKDKTFIDESVAEGLLSRVYLVMNRWDDAAAMAHAAREGYSLMNAAEAAEYNYQDIDNKEVMWGCDITDNTKLVYASFGSWYSTDGYGYGGQIGAYHLIDAALYNSISATDARKSLYIAPGSSEEFGEGGQAWTAPEYANLKFRFVKDWLGDVVYMRVAEMYLTEAEALARGGHGAEANTLMREFMSNRDEASTKTSFTANDIYQQRRIELWGEGFTYYDHLRLGIDLKRTYEGTNEPETSQANIKAGSYRWIYQLPLTEIQNNEFISESDQNPAQ